MDIILFNGNFYSLDEMYKNCTAVAIKNGIVPLIGQNLNLPSEIKSDISHNVKNRKTTSIMQAAKVKT